MTVRSLVPLVFAAALGLHSPASARGAEPDAEEGRKDASVEAEKRYKAGTKALDDERWKDAETAFAEVLRLHGTRSDAATYWLAYSLNKQGRKADALALVRAFGSRYPGSSWGKEVRALELEIRGGRGPAANPDAESDEELKLMAINSLVHTDPERAVPLLEKILRGRGSDDMKERALFVLAQSGSPRARQLIADVARGNAHPDLQEKALHYLGVFGGRGSVTFLSKVTTGCAIIFMLTSLTLAWRSSHSASVLSARRNIAAQDAAKKAVEKGTPQPPGQTAPSTEGAPGPAENTKAAPQNAPAPSKKQ